MLKVTLPGLYNKYKLNLCFINYCKKHKQQLIDEDIFFTIFGSIPQNNQSGHRNIIVNSNLLLYNQIEELINTYNKNNCVCRFDFSNLIFSPNDYNVFGKTLLNLGNNGSNQIEISTLESYEYFHINYPLYKIVGSKSLIDFTDSMNLKYLVREPLLSTEPPKNYPKNDIEYIILSPCNKKCQREKWSNCVLQENLFINTFSQNSTFASCPHLNSFIFNQTENNLKRVQFCEYNSVWDQLLAYISILIKPEFQFLALGCMMKELNV